TEQRQDRLRRRVRLRQHRDARLLEDLEPRELRHLGREVRVTDRRLGRSVVLDRDVRVVERVLDAVLGRADGTQRRGDRAQGRVDGRERGLRVGGTRDIGGRCTEQRGGRQ